MEELDTPQEQPQEEVALETGRLLPRWATKLIYGLGVPWCVLSALYICYSAALQRRTVESLRLVSGRSLEEPLPLSDPGVRKGADALKAKPRDSLLYLIEELQQSERESPSMLKALALDKALRWGVNSDRRLLIQEILTHMDRDANFAEGYELPRKHATVLKALIEERKKAAYTSYEDKKITQVLEWIAAGWKTSPEGREYRRVKSLQEKYAKRVFLGGEVDALERIVPQWRQKEKKLYREAAQKFEKMLEFVPCSLSPAERQLCERHRSEYKHHYMVGRRNLSELTYEFVKDVKSRGLFLDHPPIYVMASLLGSPYDAVRQNMKKCLLELRESRFVIEYLAEFARRSQINAIMAVETEMLTREEHEQLLREENDRRRKEVIPLLTTICMDWVEKRAQMDPEDPNRENPFRLNVANPVDFFKFNFINALQVMDEEPFRSMAAQSLEEIRAQVPEHFE